MENITEYSDTELSLIFMNDERLYKFMIRTSTTETELIDYVMDNYIYTEEQLDDLIDTYREVTKDL